jgi:hypothetical protein
LPDARRMAVTPRASVAQTCRPRCEGGIADLDAAAKADSTKAEPWFWRGVAQHDLRNWKEALSMAPDSGNVREFRSSERSVPYQPRAKP